MNWSWLLKKATKDRTTKGSTDMYIANNQGGHASAKADFDGLKLDNVKKTTIQGEGEYGYSGLLPDGTKVNIHFPGLSNDGWTIGIAKSKTGAVTRGIKIRYGK